MTARKKKERIKLIFDSISSVIWNLRKSLQSSGNVHAIRIKTNVWVLNYIYIPS